MLGATGHSHYCLQGKAMIAFFHRLWMHYDIYRRYPLPWFPALRNAWRIARL